MPNELRWERRWPQMKFKSELLIKFEKSHRLLIEACYAVTHLLHRAGSRYNELNACGGI